MTFVNTLKLNTFPTVTWSDQINSFVSKRIKVPDVKRTGGGGGISETALLFALVKVLKETRIARI
jgi:hypothetical protein